MTEVKGRTLLVTGGASGIGLSIARTFAEAGARIVIADIEGEKAEWEARALGGLAVRLDVADPLGWTAAAAAVSASGLGPVDLLCNSAGVGSAHVPVTEISPERLRRLFDINLFGAIAGVRQFGPEMRKRGGHIINVGSIVALGVLPRLGDYCAAKAALMALSECLFLEMQPYGVGVTLVCPGRVATDMGQSTLRIMGGGRGAPGTAPPQSILPADAVGPMVLDAVRTDRLYCFTHAQSRALASFHDRSVAAGLAVVEALPEDSSREIVP